MENLLTIDVGNTSTKVGCFQKGELKWVKPYTPTTTYDGQVILSKVSDRSEFDLPSIGHLRQGRDFLGMPVHYTETLGEDRLACAFYAFKKYQNCLVIDAGTFLTIDHISDKGFLGGHIIPGKSLYFQSYKHGHQLKELSPEFTKKLPQSSEQAIGSGFSALINSYLTQFKGKILITGGDGEWLKTQLSEQLDIEFCPALIHYALWIIQQETQRKIFS